MSTAALVRAFRTACGLPVGKEPQPLSHDRSALHSRLLREEVNEYADAALAASALSALASGRWQPSDLADVAQEIADVVIAAYGAALDHGIDLDPVIAEVMAANMRKVGPDGTVTRRADGKILKPPGWTGPDVAGVLARQGRQWYITTLRSTTPDAAVLSARIDELESEEGA